MWNRPWRIRARAISNASAGECSDFGGPERLPRIGTFHIHTVPFGTVSVNIQYYQCDEPYARSKREIPSGQSGFGTREEDDRRGREVNDVCNDVLRYLYDLTSLTVAAEFVSRRWNAGFQSASQR